MLVLGGYDVQENPNEVRNLLGMVPQQVSLYKGFNSSGKFRIVC